MNKLNIKIITIQYNDGGRVDKPGNNEHGRYKLVVKIWRKQYPLLCGVMLTGVDCKAICVQWCL